MNTCLGIDKLLGYYITGCGQRSQFTCSDFFFFVPGTMQTYTRDELEELSRKSLQSVAKKLGIRANSKVLM